MSYIYFWLIYFLGRFGNTYDDFSLFSSPLISSDLFRCKVQDSFPWDAPDFSIFMVVSTGLQELHRYGKLYPACPIKKVHMSASCDSKTLDFYLNSVVVKVQQVIMHIFQCEKGKLFKRKASKLNQNSSTYNSWSCEHNMSQH